MIFIEKKKLNSKSGYHVGALDGAVGISEPIGK